MKDYIRQIYEEGLGYTIYKPIENIIKKNFKGKMQNNIIILIKILYGLLVLGIFICLIYYKFPFK